MNVLIACEESQRVCEAFRNRGHNAFSCDIIKPSVGIEEWHILDDVVPYLNGNICFATMDGETHYIQKWDLIIAHPPCTYLSNAGANRLYKGGKLNEERFQKGLKAKEFFLKMYEADCERICVENPVPSKIYGLPQYSQIIHPWMFGEPYQKRTCLWLKGLPLLEPTQIVEKRESTKTAEWFNKGGVERQRNRSKTFRGIAEAMAEQWG